MHIFSFLYLSLSLSHVFRSRLLSFYVDALAHLFTDYLVSNSVTLLNWGPDAIVCAQHSHDGRDTLSFLFFHSRCVLCHRQTSCTMLHELCGTLFKFVIGSAIAKEQKYTENLHIIAYIIFCSVRRLTRMAIVILCASCAVSWCQFNIHLVSLSPPLPSLFVSLRIAKRSINPSSVFSIFTYACKQ